MHRYFQFALMGAAATALFVACEQSTTRDQARPSITEPSLTLASPGFVSSVAGRGNAGAFHIRSTDGFDVEIKAQDNTDVAIGSVVAAPGSNSGWHSHPGPVIVVVKTGTMTFYRAGKHTGQTGEENGDNGPNAPMCTRTDYPAGSAFLEVPAPGHVMLARNEGTVEATVSATYFAPPGAALRINQPAPGGNCPE